MAFPYHPTIYTDDVQALGANCHLMILNRKMHSKLVSVLIQLQYSKNFSFVVNLNATSTRRFQVITIFQRGLVILGA